MSDRDIDDLIRDQYEEALETEEPWALESYAHRQVLLTGIDRLEAVGSLTVDEADRLSEEGKGFWVSMHPDAEPIAREFHAAYEGLAPFHGYETRTESAVPWEEVPDNNRELMIATVDQLLRANIIRRVRPRHPAALPSHAVHNTTTTVQTGDAL